MFQKLKFLEVSLIAKEAVRNDGLCFFMGQKVVGADFIEKVRNNLENAGVLELVGRTSCAVGVGISGGADSVALFLALAEIFGDSKQASRGLGCNPRRGGSDQRSGREGVFATSRRRSFERASPSKIIAVTVNHHIRADEETNGDVEFVKSLARKYPNVRLVVCDLPEGEVRHQAEIRGSGIEEAARTLRYECFDRIIESEKIGFFCLAHNQNDNLETILMRLLQGNPAIGIKPRRGKYVRPLLNIERSKIEEFLKSRAQDWRTDKTNFDDNYFRNNVRLNLVPLLDEKFSGWKTSLLRGSEKQLCDSEILEEMALKIPVIEKDGVLTCSETDFLEASAPIRRRLLIRMANNLGFSERLSAVFLDDVTGEIEWFLKANKTYSKRFSFVEVGCKNHNVFVKRYQKKQTDFGFFDIIREEGEYDFPFGFLKVQKAENGSVILTMNGEKTVCGDLPFVVRSAVAGEKKRLFVVEELEKGLKKEY